MLTEHLSHTNGSLQFLGMLRVVFNIHVEAGNYYSESTFIMTVIKQENLVFILVILYIREYLHTVRVFTKLFTGTRVSEDFQFQVGCSLGCNWTLFYSPKKENSKCWRAGLRRRARRPETFFGHSNDCYYFFWLQACVFSGFFTNLPLPQNVLQRREVHVATKGRKK